MVSTAFEGFVKMFYTLVQSHSMWIENLQKWNFLYTFIFMHLMFWVNWFWANYFASHLKIFRTFKSEIPNFTLRIINTTGLSVVRGHLVPHLPSPSGTVSARKLKQRGINWPKLLSKLVWGLSGMARSRTQTLAEIWSLFLLCSPLCGFVLRATLALWWEISHLQLWSQVLTG